MSKHPSRNQLKVYGEGKGTPEFRSAIEQHLQACSECKKTHKSKPDEQLPPLQSEANAGGNRTEHRNFRIKPPKLDAPVELVNHPDYEVLQLLGRGGMGAVYLVKHLITGRLEAIKVLLPHLVTRVELRKRFLREIQAAAQLDHPNICRTLNALSEKGLVGLVMEYLRGETLLSVVKKNGPLDYKKACAIAIQICSAIDHACSKGMIHRDLKPANILLLKHSNRLQVKVLDFGLALVTGDDSSDGLTRFGGILGTPEYMAPEQALSPTNVDVRADLYSLGCIIYFMLTGEPPFRGETPIAIVQAKLAENSTNNLAINGVPSQLTALVTQLLSKDPNERPQDAKTVIAALKTIGVQSRNQVETAKQNIPDDLLEIAKSSRPPRKRKQSNSGILGIFLGILPTILLVGAAYIYRDNISQLWSNSKTTKSTNGIVVRNMPPAVEVWLNGHKAEFLRPNGSPDVIVSVLPGRYEFALKSTKLNQIVFRQFIDVPAQRDVYIEFDDALLSRLKQIERNENITPDQSYKPAPPKNNFKNPIHPPVVIPLTEQELSKIRQQISVALKARNIHEARQVLTEHRQKRGSIDDAALELLELATKSLESYMQLLSSSLKSLPQDKLMLMGKNIVKVRSSSETVVEFAVWPDNGEARQYPVDQLPLDNELSLAQTVLDSADAEGLLALGLGVITHPEFAAANTASFVRIAKRESAIKTSSPTNGSLVECQRLLHDFEVDLEGEKSQPDIGTLVRRFPKTTSGSAAIFVLPLEVDKSKELCLITSNKDGTGVTNLWNIESGEQIDITSTANAVQAIERSQNGKVIILLGGSRPPHLKAFANNLSKPFYQLNELDSRSSSIALSTNGRMLGACNSSETFFKWNLQNSKLIQKVISRQPIGLDNITHSCIAHTMDEVAVANRNGEINVWRTSDGGPLASFKISSDPVFKMRFNKNNQLVVVRSNGDIDILDPNREERILSLRLGRGAIRELSFSIESNLFVTSDLLNTVRVWDANSLECKSVFPADSSSKIVSLAIDLTGKTLVIGYENSSIEVWRLN